MPTKPRKPQRVVTLTDWTFAYVIDSDGSISHLSLCGKRVGGTSLYTPADVVLRHGRFFSLKGTVEYVVQGQPAALRYLKASEAERALGLHLPKNVTKMLADAYSRGPAPSDDDLTLMLTPHGVDPATVAHVIAGVPKLTELLSDPSPGGGT